MPQLILVKEVDLTEKKFDTLYSNNGVIFGMDSYTSDMSIISSNGDILHSLNLGFEDGNQFVFSNSTKLLSGVYISSHERSCNCNSDCEACNHYEIRMRPDYDDKHHFEVLYRDKCWLSNRFGVNSSGHVYILEGKQVKIYLDANSMTYQGGTRKYELDTIYTSTT